MGLEPLEVKLGLASFNPDPDVSGSGMSSSTRAWQCEIWHRRASVGSQDCSWRAVGLDLVLLRLAEALQDRSQPPPSTCYRGWRLRAVPGCGIGGSLLARLRQPGPGCGFQSEALGLWLQPQPGRLLLPSPLESLAFLSRRNVNFRQPANQPTSPLVLPKPRARSPALPDSDPSYQHPRHPRPC